jgi:beta-phosphoglucomutase-like phosphatase (HAD superfamily)
MFLARLLERVRGAVTAQLAPPQVVFDLDSTVIHTGPRHLAILREFAARDDAPPRLRALAAELTMERMGWNPLTLLREHAAIGPEQEKQLRRFWFSRFLSATHLHHDVPLPGAVDYVRALHAAGARVVYLTGRDEPGMGEGTRSSLRALGFPLDDPRSCLHCKPRPDEDDAAYKRRVALELVALGPVLGAFENEPRNANIFREVFVEAEVFWLDTVCSPSAPPLAGGIHRITSFGSYELG